MEIKHKMSIIMNVLISRHNGSGKNNLLQLDAGEGENRNTGIQRVETHRMKRPSNGNRRKNERYSVC